MTDPLHHQPWELDLPATGGVDVHGLGLIDEPTCLRLLGQERLGRLGLSVRSLPVILPVNFAVHDSAVIFRSEDGDKTRAAMFGTVACLEVDQFDRFEHRGWSVLVTGRLSIVPPERSEEYQRLPVVPWGLRGDSRFIELSIDLVSGRSVGSASPTTSRRDEDGRK